MSRWVKTLVILEVLVCFGPATLLLLLGILILPRQVSFLFTLPAEAAGGALLAIGLVATGIVGLLALAYTLVRLFTGTSIKRPRLLIAIVVAALLPVSLYVFFGGSIAYRLAGALPCAAAAHILYLSRNLMSNPKARD
jgi:hypothetical protein